MRPRAALFLAWRTEVRRLFPSTRHGGAGAEQNRALLGVVSRPGIPMAGRAISGGARYA
jgi:hypothetical protein